MQKPTRCRRQLLRDEAATLAASAACGSKRPRASTACAGPRTPGVVRLSFGSIDFQLDLGIAGDDDALLHFRSRFVLEWRLAQLPPANDGVTTAVDDTLWRIASTALRALGSAH
jgi:hypothetical protein